MSAAQALKAARDAGVRIGIDGDALTLEADAAPPAGRARPAVASQGGRGRAAAHRAATAGRARTGRPSSTSGRASPSSTAGCRAIEAEARAFACCVAEWLNRNSGALAARPLPRLRWRRACPRRAAAVRHRDRPAMPGCIRAAGRHGTQAGRPRRSPPFQPWKSTT